MTSKLLSQPGKALMLVYKGSVAKVRAEFLG